ncbi:thiol:disulfide interchange protein DsbA/DsbL [Orrella daihaiensis]|uniref:Thiol:disulfide interchange protein n=1 Tax=Orrella daihaiensis TaxID=2782176 RepID=A0ABY4AJT5_9BURK|nr:thiol:disulfide interchange protein DsbA/DsbL [Orrella daihaiensis]UOD50547.1 thiol:disulfide interchange protein DsbA/DsbL [Orrella daihaiensis]
MLKFFVKFIGIGLLTAGVAVAQPADKFVNVNPPQPTEPGKIEVLEFFAYTCPHCAVLEPLVTKWKAGLPSKVAFSSVPVAFNQAMKPFQYFYYSLEAVGRLDLHPKFFVALHQEKKRLFSQEAMIDWAVDQGVDRKQFTAAMNSFGVKSKATRADQLAKGYAIQGTPSIAVGGRYLTSPSEAGGYQETIDVASELIERF